MTAGLPLVSIGIPTYNRVDLLKRSIDSALNQDYENIEIIISDNASTDGTAEICHNYTKKNAQISFIPNLINQGPSANFSKVLNNAKGQYFMWLGDDDWIDPTYVSRCVDMLDGNKSLSLVSGMSCYYRDSKKIYDGKVFNVVSDCPWCRVLSYYWKVADNAMFYGLMRTHQIKQLKMKNTMGGDWLLIAEIAFFGKVLTLKGFAVHRELGGATVSYKKIASTLGLSSFHGFFPFISIACATLSEVINSPTYKLRPFFERIVVGLAIFVIIITKSLVIYTKELVRHLKHLWLGSKKFL